MSSGAQQSWSGSPPITNSNRTDVAAAAGDAAEHDPQRSEGDAGHDAGESVPASSERPREHGGREGPEPTRFGDWEKGGRCIDF